MTDSDIKIEFAREQAVAASKPGKFNFLDRLADRNYAEVDVVINLDERSGHEIEIIRGQMSGASAEEMEALEERLARAREAAALSSYTVHLQGISNETYDEIVDLAQAEYPLEYTETRNPLTMAIEREIINSDDREKFFRVHLWAKFIKSVTAPDGSVDDDITPEWVGALIARAPLAANGTILNAVNDLRMITNWMDNLQDEGFLAKS